MPKSANPLRNTSEQNEPLKTKPPLDLQTELALSGTGDMVNESRGIHGEVFGRWALTTWAPPRRPGR